MARTVVCPVCRVPLPPGIILCPDCREDLRAIAYVQLEPERLYNAGLQAAQQGREDQAIRLLERSIESDGAPVEALVLLGKLYARRGEREPARSVWERALQRAPANSAAAEGLSYLAEQTAEETRGRDEARLAASRAQAETTRRNRARSALLMGISFLFGIACLGTLQGLAFRLPQNGKTTVPVAAASTAGAPAATMALAKAEGDSTTAAPPATGTAAPTAGAAPAVLPAPSITPSPVPTATRSSSPVPSPTPIPLPDLRAAVVAALRGLGDIDAGKIQAEQRDRTVVLSGMVPSLVARYRVEMTISAVPGVEAVDLRRLQIGQAYVVKPGDTLWGVSQTVYGSPQRWVDIARTNKLQAPYLLKVGQALVVPMP